MFLIGLLLLIIGIFFSLGGWFEQHDKSQLIITGSLASILSLMLIFASGYMTGQGSPNYKRALDINSVCEVIYTEKDADNSQEVETKSQWITLIKMPDSQYRLFTLDSQPSIGLVKVNKDRQLEPFPVESKKIEASTQEVEAQTK